jgi:hypothetical protein
MSGEELSKLQDGLAHLWNVHGPDYVVKIISVMDPDTVKHLVMANIGARATEV